MSLNDGILRNLRRSIINLRMDRLFGLSDLRPGLEEILGVINVDLNTLHGFLRML